MNTAATMMTMIRKLQAPLIANALLCLIASSAQAQSPATPRVDQRQAHQQARIAQGAASGALTAQETQRLERGQAAVQNAEAQAKADGTVTQQERRHLHRMQERKSAAIHRAKHNNKTAGAQ